MIFGITNLCTNPKYTIVLNNIYPLFASNMSKQKETRRSISRSSLLSAFENRTYKTAKRGGKKR
jgi:hypothetical protein